MTTALYKFDVGESYASKCFPARTLLCHRKDGAGHWLVAHRKTVEQKYRNVHTRKKENHHLHYKSNESESKTAAEGGKSDTLAGNTLDGPFLIQLHCVDKPSELCSVDISEQRLNAVKPEDLREFDSVVYINASVNSLSLGCFSSFCSLRELDLSLNGLRNMTFDAANFPHLEVLDLSYNKLSADDIVSIGRLSRLKVLHLSGNRLHHLPPNLGSSDLDLTQLPTTEEDTQFRALEVLMLDDNKLSSGVFSSLANLRRLQYLNLQGNRISEIPYLQLRGCLNLLQTSNKQHNEDQGLESNPTDENFKRTSELGSPQSLSHIFDMENWEEYYEGSSLPLPELQFLNLADNKIAEEEALLAAALFPMLSELVIHSNPLTTRRSGDPPLLTSYLQERLGITIKRKKTPEVVKPPVTVNMDPKWKVDERLPKVPKKPALMEAPLGSLFGDHGSLAEKKHEYLCENLTSACSSQTEVEESEETVMRTDETNQDAESFFVTQATDVPDYEFNLPSDEEEKAENMERSEDDTIPEKFKCYKMLMDAKPNPDVSEPVGIQTTVRMLEHTLKNLIVYRDSKPKLDSLQTPYREKEKRIKNLPSLKSIKQRDEKVEEMLKEIKESKTLRGIALSSVLHNTGVDKQEYEEALSLLKDMKKKYKMVHMKTVEQAARIESDLNTNQK
ncbi:X-ray radiation resistance-associated protein 1 [Centroberyx affinis]|uniref:X-ray radiation resistance-associated protein 1 n=1 Tax=Centroberyx affinis TaxID=166261 RepID=UPI003A5C04E9